MASTLALNHVAIADGAALPIGVPCIFRCLSGNRVRAIEVAA